MRAGDTLSCAWKPLGEGIYAPGCLDGVVTDMRLMDAEGYGFCPFCGSKAHYGDNGIRMHQVRRRGEIRRLG